MSARQWALWILLTAIILAVFGFIIYVSLTPPRVEH
jgi:uncharacterized membrane protein